MRGLPPFPRRPDWSRQIEWPRILNFIGFCIPSRSVGVMQDGNPSSRLPPSWHYYFWPPPPPIQSAGMRPRTIVDAASRLGRGGEPSVSIQAPRARQCWWWLAKEGNSGICHVPGRAYNWPEEIRYSELGAGSSADAGNADAEWTYEHACSRFPPVPSWRRRLEICSRRRALVLLGRAARLLSLICRLRPARHKSQEVPSPR